MTDLLVAAILAGAFGLALWGAGAFGLARRPHYPLGSYLAAGGVIVALIVVLLTTGRTDWLIVSAGALALFIPLIIIRERRAERKRR
ncbi:hypothetical protein ACX9NE_16120 [Mycobacterium sp. ML4]